MPASRCVILDYWTEPAAILQCEQKTQTQAVAAVMELERLAALQHDWDWKRAAITTRKNDDGSPEFNDLIHCEQWEVVVPSLIYD